MIQLTKINLTHLNNLGFPGPEADGGQEILHDLNFWVQKKNENREIESDDDPKIMIYAMGSDEGVNVKLKTRMNILAEILYTYIEPKVEIISEIEMKSKIITTLNQGLFPVIWYYDSSTVL